MTSHSLKQNNQFYFAILMNQKFRWKIMKLFNAQQIKFAISWNLK